MNKKILMITSTILTLSLVTIIFFNSIDNKENNIISNINKNEQVINSNMITMMYETQSGSGEYVETKDTTWPESGYIFNENLSGCENGGELEYNSQNNTVNLLSNSSDRCYVYFDKYDGVWIDNVVATNVTGSSITLDVNATSENGSITTYYYAINDSEEYQESTSNIITIDDLNKLTEYKISIYCLDSTNAKSNIYEISVSTTDESGPVINSVEVSNVSDNAFTLTVNASSDIGIKRYYYSIDNGKSFYLGEESYSFNNLKSDYNYSVIIYVVDENKNESSEYFLDVKTDFVLYFSEYIKTLFTSQGTNNLYYHNESLENGAQDDSYRYSGANPNNYVCFGSDTVTCPSDNLYRIIGVFENEVKLIKADYANNNLLGTNGEYYPSAAINTSQYPNYKGTLLSVSGYYWSGAGSNNWLTSALNSTNLNTNYLNNIGENWSDFITKHIWSVGGIDSFGNSVKEAYNKEMNNTIYSGKIGLMYVSDYGFAASNNFWTTNMSWYSSAINSNWMFLGIKEWTITGRNGISDNAFYITDSGNVTNENVKYVYTAIRPVFYLDSNVQYISGSGSRDNPYRIGL